MLAIHATGKESSRIYSRLLGINRESPDPVEKEGKDMNEIFVEGEIQLANKYIKKMLNFLIREIQFKTTKGVIFYPLEK